MTAPVPPAAARFSIFLQIERAARRAGGREALGYAIVNETRRLVPYDRAVLALAEPGGRLRLEAVSSVASFERDGPFARWLAGALDALPVREIANVTAGDLPEPSRKEWAEHAAPAVLWVPLLDRDGVRVGALWLAREAPWTEGERVLLEQLADAYAHALVALLGPARRKRVRRARNWFLGAVLAGCVAAGFVPVPRAALAPAEVAARDAGVVAAPMDGVLKGVEVAPNSRVAAGDLLARYDEAPLRARRDLAARALDVARADLRRAQQGAFGDRQSAGQVALLEAQMRVRETDLAAAEEFLARAELRAERAGLAVFADREEWTGRPVRTGERILRLADPAKVELRIDVAPADAAILAPGARVVFFLDADPLRPLAGRLVRASYETARTSEGTLAHRAIAEFDEGTAPPRIGLKGTAKIEGEDVALALYLFRRPLASFRQMIGQ